MSRSSPPRRQSPRKVYTVSCHEEGSISDMSSSYRGEVTVADIFRSRPVDDDDSYFMFKAAADVIDNALGRETMSKRFDPDIMTAEEDLIRRARAGEEDTLFPLDPELEELKNHVQLCSQNRRKREEKRPVAKKSSGGTARMKALERKRREDLRKQEEELANWHKTIKVILFILFVACVVGGVAGMSTLLLLNRPKGSTSEPSTRDGSVNVFAWNQPTESPTDTPTESPSPLPSLRSSFHPSQFASDAPSMLPSLPPTAIPTLPPTSGPITSVPSFSPTQITSSPSTAPTTSSPTTPLGLQQWILLLSPGTKEAFQDTSSPQSLAFASSDTLQEFALLTLRHSLSIQFWASDDLCMWEGVMCVSGQVVSIELLFQEVEGTLPAELSLLTSLQVLSISGSAGEQVKSNVGGRLPEEWGTSLTNLRTLELYDNRITGRIPESFADLVLLESLHLDGNDLTGFLPTRLSELTSLVTMNVSNNRLLGSLPEDWTKLSRLSRLSLDHNFFFGMLPDFAGLSELRELHLEENNFRGTIPTAIGLLSTLEWLAISSNQFTGTLPAELSLLTEIEGLEVNDNSLKGELPTSLGELSKLRVLDISDNFLTGSIPQEYNDLYSLSALTISGNSIEGTISDMICSGVIHVVADCSLECSCCKGC